MQLEAIEMKRRHMQSLHVGGPDQLEVTVRLKVQQLQSPVPTILGLDSTHQKVPKTVSQYRITGAMRTE
jgi:hypothetical protein